MLKNWKYDVCYDIIKNNGFHIKELKRDLGGRRMKRIWKRILAVLTVLLLLSPDFAQVVQAAVEFEPAATLSITGTATEGETLQAVMNGETPTGVTFEWLRSDNGGSELDGAVIDAAKESSYTLTAADVGKHIFVKVTGDGEAYSAENYVFSGKTKAVEAAVSEEDTGDELCPEENQ